MAILLGRHLGFLTTARTARQNRRLVAVGNDRPRSEQENEPRPPAPSPFHAGHSSSQSSDGESNDCLGHGDDCPAAACFCYNRKMITRWSRLRYAGGIWISLAAGLLFLSAGACLAGEPFGLSLSVSDSNHTQSTTQPSETGKRPVLESATDLPFTARWKVTYVGALPATDVLVHFFVVQIARLGQDPPPLDPSVVLVEGALLMDFDTNSKSNAEMPFRSDHPGKYLVWIEATIKQDKTSQTQHAAVELVVK